MFYKWAIVHGYAMFNVQGLGPDPGIPWVHHGSAEEYSRVYVRKHHVARWSLGTCFTLLPEDLPLVSPQFFEMKKDGSHMKPRLVTGAWLDYDLPKSYWEWNNHPKWRKHIFQRGWNHQPGRLLIQKMKRIQEIHRNPNINELDYPSDITYIFTFPGLIVLFNMDQWIYTVGFYAIQYILLLGGFKIYNLIFIQGWIRWGLGFHQQISKSPNISGFQSQDFNDFQRIYFAETGSG
jgi:hypothetical protein